MWALGGNDLMSAAHAARGARSCVLGVMAASISLSIPALEDVIEVGC
jgi:hypothetical protein